MYVYELMIEIAVEICENREKDFIWRFADIDFTYFKFYGWVISANFCFSLSILLNDLNFLRNQ